MKRKFMLGWNSKLFVLKFYFSSHFRKQICSTKQTEEKSTLYLRKIKIFQVSSKRTCAELLLKRVSKQKKNEQQDEKELNLLKREAFLIRFCSLTNRPKISTVTALELFFFLSVT